MKELLEKLLTVDFLNEETKKELTEAFLAELAVAKEAARQEAINEVKVEFATKFAEDKAALVEAIDTKITAALNDEIAELKEDIERFRDLEAEYATKLVEEKEKLGLQLKADMAKLVETLDVFLENCLNEEITELKESIEEVKKIKYAKDLFEHIEKTFHTKFFNDNGVSQKLEENAKELEQKNKKLQETEAALNKLIREKEMTRVLESLHGRPREIMEAVLVAVPTEKLDESYAKFIGRVLHETSASKVDDKSEKESVNDTSVLAESNSTDESTKTIVVTGNSVVENVEETKPKVLSEAETLRLRRLAGIS